MSKGAQVTELLNGDRMVVVPTAYDALSAKLVEEAGFAAVYVSGFAVSTSMGLADVGLLTLTELVERVHLIADAVEIPVICDADSGFGNYLNVRRLVHELEQVGVGAITFGDQVTPSTNRADRALISSEEMSGKIRAAVEIRRSPDTPLIFARTDAAPSYGMDEAIDRVQAYVDAGADAVHVLEVRSVDDLKSVVSADELKRAVEAMDVPSIGVLPHPPTMRVSEMEDLGFDMLVVALPLQAVAAKAIADLLNEVQSAGRIDRLFDRMVTTKFVTDLLNLPAVRELETVYGGERTSEWTPW